MYEKKSQQDLGGGLRLLEDVGSGGKVKAHVLLKIIINIRENCISAKQRKRGPLGKGNY